MDEQLTQLMGGPRPVREFTLARFQVVEANSAAFAHAKTFDATSDNLYLWGACGVGKTHLAYAIGRRAVESGASALFLTPRELVRRVRMKDPDEEQRAILELVCVAVLVIDDLGVGTDTPYSRQLLQEILDRRKYRDRDGLVVTTKYSLDQLASKFADDSIPSRLAGMCRRVSVGGPDRRLTRPPVDRPQNSPFGAA